MSIWLFLLILYQVNNAEYTSLLLSDKMFCLLRQYDSQKELHRSHLVTTKTGETGWGLGINNLAYSYPLVHFIEKAIKSSVVGLKYLQGIMSINRTKVSKMKAGTMESLKFRVQDITWSWEKLKSSLANQQKQEQRHRLIWRLMNILHCIQQLDPGKFQEKTSPLKRWLEKVHLDRLLKEQPQSWEGEMERQEWPLRCWKVPFQAKTVLCFPFHGIRL